MDVGLFDNKHYGYREAPVSGSYYIVYNKDIMEKEGMPDIFELQQTYAWTWDSMLDIAINTTKDLNGDGFTEQWGLEDNDGSLNIQFLHSNGGDYILQDDSGNYHEALTTPASLRAFSFVSNLYNVYKVVSPLRSTTANNYSKGAVAMMTCGTATIQRQMMPNNSGYVICPKGPDVDRYRTAGFGGSIWTIPTYNKEPQVTANIIKELFTLWDENDANSLTYDEAVVTQFQNKMFCENDTITLRINAELVEYPYYANFCSIYLSGQAGTFNANIKLFGMPVRTAVDRFVPSVESMLIDILK